MKTLKILFCSLSLFLLAGSCKKDKENTPSPSKPTPYFVSMTDAPGPYKAVYIDLQAVEVIGDGNTTMLNAKAGIYNLLDLSNGNDTLIAMGSLSVDHVQQIRLILGPNNSIVTSAGVTYPLKTPSAQQSGLKLQVHQDLQAGVAYHVLLDFDAAQSIVEQGNGDYSLKPVIRTIEVALSGAIKGKISQNGVLATITASSPSGSYSTIANANGEFVIGGLPAGTYTLNVNPVLPYNSVTLNNVSVTTGVTTDVGVIVIN
jgi:hypothetical protein